MKEIKRFGNLKIPKSWEVIGRKKLKTFISSYPYLKHWFFRKIERPDIEWWKKKSKITAFLSIFPKEYLASFLAKDDKQYRFLLLRSKRQLIKNNEWRLYDFLVEEEDGH